METPLQIAAGILGEIDWHEEHGYGYCRCPGLSFHQNSTGKRDTRVYLTGAPTVTCFHSSCLAAVEDANWKLRSAIGRSERGIDPGVRRFEKSAEQIAREKERVDAARLVAEAREVLPKILRDYHWPLEDIWHESPGRLDDVADDWRRLLCLFDPSEVTWIGDKRDSGSPKHRGHFRPAGSWLKLSECPAGPHISPFVYAPGCFSRKAANVVTRKFLVVESDSLSKDDQGAILRWLRDLVGLHLRAIIDTAGRSIHGWFDVPAPDALKELVAVLPALGCDPALLRPTQVSRLPSCHRGKKTQGLLYIDQEENKQ